VYAFFWYGPLTLMMASINKCFIFQFYVDDAGRIKRKRKPSEKVLELQAEKVKRSSKSSKLAKPKSKSLVDQDNGNSFHGDGLSD